MTHINITEVSEASGQTQLISQTQFEQELIALVVLGLPIDEINKEIEEYNRAGGAYWISIKLIVALKQQSKI